MRWGAFVMGGLLGAAVAVYMSRNFREMSFPDAARRMFGRAVGGRRKFFVDPDEVERKAVDRSESGGDLDDVRRIVDNDPELNKQFRDIMAENGNQVQ